MKETQHIDKDEITIVKQSEQHTKKQSLVGTIQVIKGTNLYEFNSETQEINQVTLEAPLKYAFENKQFSQARFKTDYNPKSLYVRAINRKNAIRKVRQQLGKNLIIKNENTNI